MSDRLPDLSTDPRALRVRKRPVLVPVEFATADGTCETLEGPVRFRAGDAILTGVQGERWPVNLEAFRARYAPVPPTRAGENGAYRKVPSLSLALRLEQPLDVPVGWRNDPLHGHVGDWLLQYAIGDYGIMHDEIFRDRYAPASDETRWPPSR